MAAFLVLASCGGGESVPPLRDALELEEVLSEYWARFEEFYDPELAAQLRGAVSRGEVEEARRQLGPCSKAVARRLAAVGVDAQGLRTWISESPPPDAAGWTGRLRDASGTEAAGALALVLTLSGESGSAVEALARARDFESLVTTLAHIGKVLTFTTFELVGPPAYRRAKPRDVLREMIGREPDRFAFAAAGLRILSDRIFVDSYLRHDERLECREREPGAQHPAYRVLAGYVSRETSPVVHAARVRNMLDGGKTRLPSPAEPPVDGFLQAAAAALDMFTRADVAEASLHRAASLPCRTYSSELRAAEAASRDGPAAEFVAARNQHHPHTQWMISLANWAAKRDEDTIGDALTVVRLMVKDADTFDERLPLLRAERRLQQALGGDGAQRRILEITRAHIAYERFVTVDHVLAAWARSFFAAETPDPEGIGAVEKRLDAWLEVQKPDPALVKRSSAGRREALKLCDQLLDRDPASVDAYLIRRGALNP